MHNTFFHSWGKKWSKHALNNLWTTLNKKCCSPSSFILNINTWSQKTFNNIKLWLISSPFLTSPLLVSFIFVSVEAWQLLYQLRPSFIVLSMFILNYFIVISVLMLLVCKWYNCHHCHNLPRWLSAIILAISIFLG